MSEFGGENSEVKESPEVKEAPAEKTGGESSEATKEAAEQEASEQGGFEDNEADETPVMKEDSEEEDSEEEKDESQDVGFDDSGDVESQPDTIKAAEEKPIPESDEDRVGFDDSDEDTDDPSGKKETDGVGETEETGESQKTEVSTEAEEDLDTDDEDDEVWEDEEDPGEWENYPEDPDDKNDSNKAAEQDQQETINEKKSEPQPEENTEQQSGEEMEETEEKAVEEEETQTGENRKDAAAQPEKEPEKDEDTEADGEENANEAAADPVDSEEPPEEEESEPEDYDDPEDSEDYRDEGEAENYEDDDPAEPAGVTEQKTAEETAPAEDTDSKTGDASEEDAYRSAMNNMSDYMNAHNYGREDYAEYSQDPEWQKLNADLQRSLGMEVTTDAPAPEKGKDASDQLPDNCVMVNASDIDMTYAPGMDSDQFWNHHGNTKEDYMRVAERIPDVQEALESGKTFEELKQDPELSDTVRAYYDPQNMVKVEQQPDGSYSFASDGRHRIAAAQELGYQIPVEVTNMPETPAEGKPEGQNPEGKTQTETAMPPDGKPEGQETPPLESEFGGYSLNVSDAQNDPNWIKAEEIRGRLEGMGETAAAEKLEEALEKATSGSTEASPELIASLKEAGTKLVESGDPKAMECGQSLLNLADEKAQAVREEQQDGRTFTGLRTEGKIAETSEQPNPENTISSETRETLDAFVQGNWDNLSQTEKETAVENLRDNVAKDLQLENKPNIAYYNKEDPGDYGGYAASTNTIYINRFNMGDAAETADTIAHESRHCWQHERAENPKTEQDQRFKENFEDYIRPEDDFFEYQNQPVEADARDYAQEVKNVISEKGEAAPGDLGQDGSGDYQTSGKEGSPEAGTTGSFEKQRVITEKELPNDFESKEKFVPVTDNVKKSLEGSGLTAAKITEIRNLPKPDYKNGQEMNREIHKPDPKTYLKPEYIEKHLEPFERTGCFKIQRTDPTGPNDLYDGNIGHSSGVFVTSGEDMKKAVLESGGNVRKMERIFGLEEGSLGNNPTIISFDDPKNLRIPDGNEIGADRNKYIPGGFTCGNQPEAVIDPVSRGEYKVTKFNDPNLVDWIDKRGGR